MESLMADLFSSPYLHCLFFPLETEKMSTLSFTIFLEFSLFCEILSLKTFGNF